MWWKILFAAALMGAAAIGATTANPFEDEHVHELPPPVSDFKAARGSRSIEGRDRHPNGGPPWAVLVYRTPGGKTCSAPGRLVRGRLGRADDRGDFTEAPVERGASCVNFLIDETPFGLSRNLIRDDPHRAGDQTMGVVWGVARPAVQKIRMVGPGIDRTLRPGPRGGFLATLDAREARSRLVVRVLLRDGSSRAIVSPPLPAAQNVPVEPGDR